MTDTRKLCWVAATAAIMFLLPAMAKGQSRVESRNSATKQRCGELLLRIGGAISAQNAQLLREFRDCDQSSGPLIARLWERPIENASVLTSLIRASSDVHDARISNAVESVVRNSSRTAYERAAALTVLANYMDSAYMGRAEQVGSRIRVQLVSLSHAATWIPGSHMVRDADAARIVSLISSLREPDSLRELRDIALLIRLPGEK